MNIVPVVLTFLIAHFFGDWFCQPRWMARKKSENLLILLAHLAIVTAWLGAGLFFLHCFKVLPTTEALFQAPMTMKLTFNAVIHGAIDWNIWRNYKNSIHMDFEYWKDKRFYDTIAMDQLLHLGTLAILFL